MYASQNVEMSISSDIYMSNNTSEREFIVRLNPTVIPAKYTRYRHPSHCHRLFITKGCEHRDCDNRNCRTDIMPPDATIFRCFKCDFDLCSLCFQLDSLDGYMVPLAEDDETIDENIVIPLRVLLSVNPTDI
jgi:hypothetical protein